MSVTPAQVCQQPRSEPQRLPQWAAAVGPTQPLRQETVAIGRTPDAGLEDGPDVV
ncbi:hypothetical protein [Streptomyces mirabilis]|uniref:hypothetical protein n=1 Tax=Streptomyces mirabilis TaxID=68239 RepID=UPI00332CF033